METFNSWVRDNDLDDVQLDNRNFTWSNKRNAPTLARLDRVLENAFWNLGFLQTTAAVVPATTSDHTPVLVQFDTNAMRSNFFRMENHWLEMEETRSIIIDSWTRGHRTLQSSASVFSFKMRRVRAALRAWSRKNRASESTLTITW